MGSLKEVSNVCIAFKEKKIEIEEFQHRLETAMVSYDFKRSFEKALFDTINKLEEIRFTSLERNLFKYGTEIANNLLDLINCEQK
jgi:hypothetical protein